MQITLKAHSIYVNGPYRAHAQDVRRQRFGRSISQPIQPSRQYHAPHGSGNVCVPPGIGFSPVSGFLWRMLGCGYGQYGLVREALMRLVSWCFSDVSYFRRVSAMARKHCETSQSGVGGAYLFFTAQSQTVPSVFCAASLCKSPSCLSRKRGATAVLRTRRMSSAHVVFAFHTFILRSAPVNVSLVRYLAAPLYRWQPSLNPAYSLSSRGISLQSAGEHQFPHRAKGIGDQAMHSPFRPSIRQCLFDIILTLLDPSQNSCSRAKPCCWSILWSCLCSP